MGELRKIPGVGKAVEEDLKQLGINRIEELKGLNPQGLYDELCKVQNSQIDRCMLYVFRCAIYFASHKNHKPELLKWWNWKDKEETRGSRKSR